jgi:hypothetical protein
VYDPTSGLELPDFSRMLVVSKKYLITLYMEELKDLDDFLNNCKLQKDEEIIPYIEEVK